MLTGRDVRTALVVVVLVTGEGSTTVGDHPLPPDANAKLTRMLSDWQRRSSARKSLDVRFMGETRRPAWNERERFTGRVVLLRKGLARLDYESVSAKDQQGRTQHWI